jgi:uncharacterized membrane protein
MKLLQMEIYLSKVYIFMDNLLETVPLASALYKLDTCIIQTICRNRNSWHGLPERNFKLEDEILQD